MDSILLGTLLIVAMVGLVALGVPVGVSMSLTALAGMWAFGGSAFMLGTFMTLPYSIAGQYAFVVIPMFVLMGALAAAGGITSELYTAAHHVFSRMRGGLYYATIMASAAFGAVSGSTVVAGAVFSRIALPEMISRGYNRGVAAGCIAAAGTFAALIPPSISMVIYGILTGESIGALLMAGLLPGILTAVIYMIATNIALRFRPDWAPPMVQRYPLKEILKTFRGLWALILLVIIVIGGIYSGIMPPSAAGTIGALGALLICLVRRRLTRASLWEALRETASMTSALFLIIIGGLLFTRLLLSLGFVTELTKFTISMEMSAALFIAFVIVIYLILGCFIDTVSMMVMTIPFLYPLLKPFGLDGIWFGVIIVKLVEIAAITPPVGLNLYAVLGASNGRVSTGELFRGVFPFVAIELMVLLVLVIFPQISLWLPRAMMQ
jgi:tripartite ATP-independent transporter DctM subunit